jgi:hypothetical protein
MKHTATILAILVSLTVLAVGQGYPGFAGHTFSSAGILLRDETFNGKNSFARLIALDGITAPSGSNCVNIEQVRCVDSPNSAGWLGSDVGAWINAAYNDLPSESFGHIIVVPHPSGTCYAVSTPIRFTTSGKGVLLELLPGTCFTFASTSETFLTFDACGNAECGTSGATPFRAQKGYATGLIGHGAWISGSGGTSIGITIGGSNGAEGLRFEGFEIDGFNININDGGNAFQVTIKDVVSMNAASHSVLLTHPSEIWKFEGGKYGSNFLPMAPNCFSVSGQTRVVMTGVSLDSCQLTNNAGSIAGHGVHFESIAGHPKGCGSANPLVVNTRGGLALFDPEFWADCTTGAGVAPVMLIDTGVDTGNAEYLSIFGGAVHVTDTDTQEVIRQQGGIAVTVFGLQNNSADAYPMANGVVFRNLATGPTIVGPSTTGMEGTSAYTAYQVIGGITGSADFEVAGTSSSRVTGSGNLENVGTGQTKLLQTGTTDITGADVRLANGISLRGYSDDMQTQMFSLDASSGNAVFAGNLNIKGTLTKGGGSFKIDHPLDPANKFLSHSFVESPDMMNVYNGNVTTDKDGLATVVLPDYFEALNRDFRYQLTVIGRKFAQAIVVQEVANHCFTIKTNKPSVTVSWQVTGIRHDAYADAYRIPVEEDKSPEEQGRYLHPELFGTSDRRAIGATTPAPLLDRSAPQD